jgi:hypothetical protein
MKFVVQVPLKTEVRHGLFPRLLPCEFAPTRKRHVCYPPQNNRYVLFRVMSSNMMVRWRNLGSYEGPREMYSPNSSQSWYWGGVMVARFSATKIYFDLVFSILTLSQQ